MTESASPAPPSNDDVASRSESSVEVRGQASHNQSTLGLVVIALVAVGLMVWLLAGRTSPDEQPVAGDDTTTTTDPNELAAETESVEENPDSPAGVSASSTVPSATVGSGSSESADAVELSGMALDGWRLVVGDGHNVELIDLDSGDSQRHVAVGAPIAASSDRLLFYQNSQLFWLATNGVDLDDEIASDPVSGVPTLQVMFVRPRSTDRPVVVGASPADRAIWWPNNNTDPQRWLKISLSDGSALDETSLSSDVFGGPEVVATLGSGSFERVDGRWTDLGNLFATSVSPTAILGQECVTPEQCGLVVRDRRTGRQQVLGDDLAVDDAALVADADRTLVVTSTSLAVLDEDSFEVLSGLEPGALIVNRGPVVASTTGTTSSDDTESTLVLYHIDQQRQAEVTVGTGPRWLVLMPPDGLTE